MKRFGTSSAVIALTIIFCLSSFRLAPVMPAIIIYKMKKDYSKNVPVTLSKDKKSVVSYPDIKDVYYNGVLAYPTQLHDGYWLDNRGIGPNTAFIKLTYDEYAKLPATPSAEELYKMVIDTNPIKHMYNMGKRGSFADAVKDINNVIDNNGLKQYKKLK